MCRSFIFSIFCLFFTLLFNQSNTICHGNDTKLLPSIVVTEDLTSADFDAIIVVASEISSIAFDGLKDPLAYFLSGKFVLFHIVETHSGLIETFGITSHFI